MEVKEVKMIDVTSPELVEIIIGGDNKTVWVNIEGVCMFRACRIKQLIFERDGKFIMEEVKGG